MNRYEINEGRTYMYYKGKPSYNFGYGLSYSSFKYYDLQISQKEISKADSITVKFKIKNTGKFNSDEVAQLYVNFPESKSNRPLKQLKAFKRVHLKKGEEKEISLALKTKNLVYWSVKKNEWNIEEGTVNLLIGASSEDIRLKGKILIKD